MGALRAVLSGIGPVKSLKAWAELAGSSPANGVQAMLREANLAVNNTMDIEFYRAFTFWPQRAEEIFQDRYFEFVGHSYHIAYGHLLSMLCDVLDPTFDLLPKAPMWDDEFRRLTAARCTGFYYGSPIQRAEVGLYAIFEGQARFIQLQLLAFGTGGELTFEQLRVAGYMNGVYAKAFEHFLRIVEDDWPERVVDPLVGLFLLICDLAINPTAGFPFDIEDFENFIIDVDPGIRFHAAL